MISEHSTMVSESKKGAISMCGISGFIGKEIIDRENILKEMMEVMRHRGPDSDGTYFSEEAALGFCRLSIIDLQEGGQPMFNETGELVLIFNGEIYNYQELREELVKKGHVFANHSDSEVLLHGYEEYGEKLLDRLRGMFAFVIWDSHRKKLFAARDFFGIKPFYYGIINGSFVFASEIKSILAFPGYEKKVNEEALEQYLSFQYSALEETFFEGIFKLQPGHYLTYEDQIVKIRSYFDPMLTPEKEGDEERLIDELDEVIQGSIKQHMVSDVEVGSFLSGGVDSSLIAACFTGDRSFTVGFPKEGDHYTECDQADSLAKKLKLNHTSRTIEEDEYWEAVPKVMYHLDEPSGDAAAVALYFVAGEAAKHVKVVTSGEGADELFGGYNIYLEPQALRWISWLPGGMRRRLGEWAERMPRHMKGRSYLIRASKDVEERFIGNANIFSKEEREIILKHPGKAVSPAELLEKKYRKAVGLSDMDKMQYIDLTSWLPGDILQKADKMSMAHSLELRVPFLDRNVFETARRLPSREKTKHYTSKYLFRKAAERHLPKENTERRKLGFPVPIRVWIRQEKGYEKIKERFTSSAAQQYFCSDQLLKLLEEHKSGQEDNSRKIWTVYAFLVWHQVFFEQSGR